MSLGVNSTAQLAGGDISATDVGCRSGLSAKVVPFVTVPPAGLNLKMTKPGASDQAARLSYRPSDERSPTSLSWKCGRISARSSVFYRNR
jgi:hypothetical protein